MASAYAVFHPGDLVKGLNGCGVELTVGEETFRQRVLPWIVESNLSVMNWQVVWDDDNIFLYAPCVIVVRFASPADARRCQRKWGDRPADPPPAPAVN